MKVGIVVGLTGSKFSAPLMCQRKLYVALQDMDTGLDLIPVEDRPPLGLDLLHVDNIPFRAYQAWRVRKAPLVVAHAHGNLVWAHPELMENGPHDRALMRFWASMSRNQVDAFIPVSHYLRYFLCSWGVSPDRLHTVYNGIDPLYLGEAPARSPEMRPYILHVSKYQPKKNTEALVEAYQTIRKGFPEHDLIIAGPGHGRSQNPSPKGVTILGKVPASDLHRLYAGAACFVFPTLHETFGLPVVEAMATGCPVVTTRRGSMPEVGDSAVEYCEPTPASIAATVMDLLDNPSRQRTLRTRGKSRAKTFSWERAASDVLRVYEEVLS